MAQPTSSTATALAKDTARNTPQEVALRINLLIHTMHEMERHEEDLCGLMHELQRADRITREVRAELDHLLASLAFRSFAADLDSIRRALHSPAVPPPPARKQPAPRPPSRSKPTARRTAPAAAKRSRVTQSEKRSRSR